MNGDSTKRAEILSENEEVRRWYHDQLSTKLGQIDERLPLREQALLAFKLRNEIKMEARELMADR